jgi:hypothetical protein
VKLKNENDIPYKGIGLVLLFFTVRGLFQFFTEVTRFFPFSEFFQERPFHYRFKRIRKAIDKVQGGWLKSSGFSIIDWEMDEHFLTFHGIFTNKRKVKSFEKFLSKQFGKNNFYFNLYQPSIYRIAIPVDRLS